MKGGGEGEAIMDEVCCMLFSGGNVHLGYHTKSLRRIFSFGGHFNAIFRSVF